MGTWVHVFNLPLLDFWGATCPEFEILAKEWLARNEPEQGISYDAFLELERKLG